MTRKLTMLAAAALAVLATALASRVVASFFMTHMYESVVASFFAAPKTRQMPTRANIDAVLAPLKSEEFADPYPWILPRSVDKRALVSIRYYLVTPALPGCYVYVVYDGHGREGRAVNYRDGCE